MATMMNNGTIILILFSIVLLNLLFPFTNLFYTELNVNIQPQRLLLQNNNNDDDDHGFHHHSNIIIRHNRSSQFFYDRLRYKKLLNIRPRISDRIQSDNIENLVKRLLPQHYKYFIIIVDHHFIDDNDGGYLDRFKVCMKNFFSPFFNSN